MKFFLLATLTSFASWSAFANEVLLHERAVVLPVEVSSTRVLLAASSYGVRVLNVVIPELADVTFLYHRNFEAGGPSLRTHDTVEANDVIQDNPKIENILFTIKLEKSTYIDDQSGECVVGMIEKVEGNIRGFNFAHSASHEMQARNAEDCR